MSPTDEEVQDKCLKDCKGKTPLADMIIINLEAVLTGFILASVLLWFDHLDRVEEPEKVHVDKVRAWHFHEDPDNNVE